MLCSHSIEEWVYKPSKATIKRWHCSGNEMKKLMKQFTVNIQNTEDDLKILLTIPSITKKPLQLLPLLLFTFMTMLCMPGHRYTQSEYALHQVVEHFSNLLFNLEQHHLTHTYRVVLHFSKLDNIDYLVLRYLNTSLLPFEQVSEEWLFDGEVWFIYTKATDFGIGLDWLLLEHRCQRLSLMIRRGKKEFLR